MFRQLLLGLTFLAAFTTLSVGVTDSADAWGRWRWNRPYVAYYGAGPGPYYSGYTPYRTSYYGPRVYRPYYYDRYYYEDPYYYGYYGPRGRVAFSIGF
jgi:hypothetical protein